MDAPKEVQPTGEFECQLCGLTAPYMYYGPKPPNSYSVMLLEEAYVMKDPFTPDKNKFIILGSHCSLCSRSVCVGTMKCLEFMKDSTDISKCGSSICQKYSISASQDLFTQCVFVKECSLFYSKRFCLHCVKENLKAFPLEIQEDMDKRKPQQESSKKPHTKHKS